MQDVIDHLEQNREAALEQLKELLRLTLQLQHLVKHAFL